MSNDVAERLRREAGDLLNGHTWSALRAGADEIERLDALLAKTQAEAVALSRLREVRRGMACDTCQFHALGASVCWLGLNRHIADKGWFTGCDQWKEEAL